MSEGRHTPCGALSRCDSATLGCGVRFEFFSEAPSRKHERVRYGASACSLISDERIVGIRNALTWFGLRPGLGIRAQKRLRSRAVFREFLQYNVTCVLRALQHNWR
jgi:hypothetical protein